MSQADPLPDGDRLQGKVAVVTGGGRGIGRAVALSLGSEGAAVVVVARTKPEIEETAALLRARGQVALAVAADVSDNQAVHAMVAQVIQDFGRVDVLVNDAGVQGPIGPLADNDPADWIRTVQINLLGTFFCCRAVLPHMMRRHSGRIINLSGGGAAASRPRFSAYAASKAAVVRLTETLAEEVREYDVLVNAIAPGAVNTRMLDQILAAGPAAGDKALAEARLQQETGGVPPELAAALVVFLASSQFKGPTGKLIAAPYDGWQAWGADRVSDLSSAPWFTLRRLDPLTLGGLVDKL